MYLVYLVRLLYVITCKLCSEYLYRVYVTHVMLCYIMFAMLCYGRLLCGALSDRVSFCASDNKRLLFTCTDQFVSITVTYLLLHINLKLKDILYRAEYAG